MGEKIDFKAALEKFRNHWIHENDVRPYLEMEQNAGDEIKNILRTTPDDKLKEKLAEYLSYQPIIDLAGINWVMDHNSLQKIKDAFEMLFDDKRKESERLDAMMSLEGVGPVFSSLFLDIATKGGYMVYERNLVDALRAADPKLLKEDFYEADNRNDLEYFMDACRKLYKKSKCTSYAEFRGFLWNGYVSDWEFKDF